MASPDRKRRIAIFTGKRGGFGAMLGIIRRIQADPEMELKIIASDMHLSETFGKTLDEITERVRVDAVVDLGDYGDQNIDRARALGRCVESLAPVLEELAPDILLLLGDRGETLAAAMCAVEMGVIVAHIQAGDISGGIDDIHRHAITKLCHLHFSQNEGQCQRVLKLGEAPERVWATGAPYVDNIVQTQHPPPADALASLGLPGDLDYFLVLQHSDSYRPELSYDEMRTILEVLTDRPEHAIIVYPCSDPGYAGIIAAIEEFEDRPRFHVHRSIEAMNFLGLMSGARALIGNSSGGIIEAPYARLPFILVGKRQDGREMAANVIPVPAEHAAIQSAIERARTAEFQDVMAADDQPFGDGHACERIYRVLKDVELSPELFRKRICY